MMTASVQQASQLHDVASQPAADVVNRHRSMPRSAVVMPSGCRRRCVFCRAVCSCLAAGSVGLDADAHAPGGANDALAQRLQRQLRRILLLHLRTTQPSAGQLRATARRARLPIMETYMCRAWWDGPLAASHHIRAAHKRCAALLRGQVLKNKRLELYSWLRACSPTRVWQPSPCDVLTFCLR